MKTVTRITRWTSLDRRCKTGRFKADVHQSNLEDFLARKPAPHRRCQWSVRCQEPTEPTQMGEFNDQYS